MYLNNPMPEEAIVSNNNENRIAELEQELDKAKRLYESAERHRQNTDKRWSTDTNILAGVLLRVLSDNGMQREHLDNAIHSIPEDDTVARDVLSYHEAAPDGWLTKDYEITITLPVTITLSVSASDEDTASDMARDELECNGLEAYSMEYNVYYDADFYVEEV